VVQCSIGVMTRKHQVSMAQCSACVTTRQQHQVSMAQYSACVMTHQQHQEVMLQYTIGVMTFKRQEVSATPNAVFVS